MSVDHDPAPKPACRISTTCTRDCPGGCGLIAVVENERVVSLTGDPDHPHSRGFVCRKAAAFVKRAYSLERVMTPLRRVGGKWERADWDDALDEIADRMQSVKGRSGPEAILYYQGYGERTALKLLNGYFFNLFGGVTTLSGSLCGGTGQAAQNLDLGQRISHDPVDHLNSKTIILWGRNPAVSNPGLAGLLTKAKKNGARILLADPLPTKSLALADAHIAPRPGSDAYLAMAAAKMVMQDDAVDADFIHDRSVGFEQFRSIAEGFSLDELCEAAGVDRDDVRLLADAMTRGKPTAVLLGWGLHRYEYAHYAVRAIDALSAMTGNIGLSGGGVSQGFEEYGPFDAGCWGDALTPPRRKLSMPIIGQEILDAADPAIEMIFVTAGNPVCMAPNSGKTAQAFRKTDFVVYAGHFLNDTADYADIFLPATTFLEERDVVASWGHNWLGPVGKAVEPPGRCKSDFDMFRELSKRFDFVDEFDKTVDEWLRTILKPMLEQGETLEDMLSKPVRQALPLVPYEDGVFPTDDGKYHFLDEFDPPERPESPVYPYTLLSIIAEKAVGSEMTLAEQDEAPVVRMNADEAAFRGLRPKALVRIVSETGEMTARLTVTDTMRKDVVAVERGGWIKAGHGVNKLTKDLVSKVGEGTPYFETKVAVRPVG